MDIKENIDAYNLGSNGGNILGPNPVESALAIRCPQCLKLFSVKIASLLNSRPRFQCSSCQQKFYIMHPECIGIGEVVGIPIGHAQQNQVSQPQKESLELTQPAQKVESKEAVGVDQSSIFDCPKCTRPYKGGETECGNCGLVFSKFELILKKESGEPESNKELNLAWKKLISNYNDRNAHQNFIDYCKIKKQLDFAAYKYKQISRLTGHEEVAQEMMTRIEKIVLVDSGHSMAEKKKGKNKTFRFSAFISVIGMSMILVGYFIPALRNLVGMGVAITFLSFALGVYFR